LRQQTGQDSSPIKVAHIITGLGTGGAEFMLYKLLSHTDRARINPCVLSLLDKGDIGPRIEALGIPVHTLEMGRGRLPNPAAMLRLALLLRRLRPRLVQTWMYHADLLGGLAARLAGNRHIVWGLRQSNLEADAVKRATAYTAKLCAALSSWLPQCIVCGSEAARRVHAELGYAEKKMRVIPNGFDLGLFRPDPAARRSLAEELNLADEAILVGLVGRFDPQKDHRTFVAAATRVAADCPNVRFLLCGAGVEWNNRKLSAWIDSAGIRDRFNLLGRRDDMPRITAALDLACSSSYGEGFPNAVGEAMACGVPCAVTDVGDSALIVGETGAVVPPKDPAALASAIAAMVGLEPTARRQLGKAARQRIADEYALEGIAQQHERLYLDLIGV
jgi:glycosyltransferase involved in cell wall biosynthesis